MAIFWETMGNFRFRIYFYGSIIAILLVFLLVPRGGTVVNTTISLAPDGKPVFQSVADKKAAFSNTGNKDLHRAKNFIQQGIYGQSFEKIDYGFVVYYRFFYRFNLANVPNYVPAQLVFSADLPGTITEVKKGTFEASKAYWVLKKGEDGDFFAESKAIRWWLIGLAGILTLGTIYLIILRAKQRSS